ncbi:hypothetical protein DL768_000261 [Monosporascus sp. mg162]|nr:hypothetical protein DL768_000261 [Monosporascus sp. mg162]
MLTSALPTDRARSGAVDNDIDISPTYENIVGSINSVTVQSRPGDVVYLQFSGYAQTVPTAIPHVRNILHKNQDLVLLPAELLTDGRCLYDVELAVLLRRLTLNGCELMVVIDGRSTFARVPKLTKLRPPEITHDEIMSVSYGTWCEDGQHTWLRNPPPGAPYTLFLVEGFFDRSGPPEYCDPKTKRRFGFLSYLLLRFLREQGQDATYNTITRRMLVEGKPWIQDHSYLMFDEIGLVVRGGIDRILLGGNQHLAPFPLTFPVALIQGGGDTLLRIEGGVAHGLRIGDPFVLKLVGNGLRREFELLLDERILGFCEITMAHGLFSLARTTMKVSETLHRLDPTTHESLKALRVGDDAIPRSCSTSIATANWSIDLFKDEGQNDPLDGSSQLSFSGPLQIKRLSPEAQASLYRSLLRIEHKSTSLSNDIDFEVVGGYGYQLFGPPRTPPFGPDGRLHLVSGDYVVLYIQSRSTRPIFVNVLCFDSAFGITQVYPPVRTRDPNMPSIGAGYKSELDLHFRLSFPVQRLSESEATPATEALKIYISDTPASFEPLEMPPISDKSFLLVNQDPVSEADARSDLGVNDRSGDEAKGANFKKSNDAEGFAPGDWCTFEARFVIH